MKTEIQVKRVGGLGRFALAAGIVFVAAGAQAMLGDDEALAAARATLAKMTPEEKCLMVGGSGTQTIAALPHLGIAREWRMHGNSSTVRGHLEHMRGRIYEQPLSVNTMLPSTSALVQTWDPEWARRHGEVIGAEMRDRGVDQLLSPGVNIARTPLCGRNWEYFGEDPCLAATMVVPMIKGVQSYDVAATIKHFCLNNQELSRKTVDTVCDARTLTEIYLPAFRAAIKEAGVLSLMTSYNKVFGLYASENRYLQEGILRDRWGFKGMIVSDWGGQHSTAFAANNGCGLEMHSGDRIRFLRNPQTGEMPLLDAVKANLVPQATLDEMALHTLYMMAKTGFLTGAPRRAGSRNTREHQLIARQEAADSIVLLRNDDGVLPLRLDGIRKLLIIGAADVRQCMIGKGGSAESNPPYEVTLYGALTNRLAGAVEVQMMLHNAGEAALRPAAEAADAVLVFIGTELGGGKHQESEGHDRVQVELPKSLAAISRAIYDWNIKKLITVSRSGSPVAYDWTDRSRTLLHTSFGGMEWGNALVDVILGEVNPSGRLCYTWPKSLAETGVGAEGTYNKTNVIYNERFYVGYRWNDRHQVKPLFPFGHGITYTTFSYGDVKVKGDEVSVSVTNTGKVEGKEVVQFYLAYPNARVERCVKDLRGFAKVSLKPGETKVVTHRFADRDFAYWDDFDHCFRTDAGAYEVLVGASAADIRGKAPITVARGATFRD